MKQINGKKCKRLVCYTMIGALACSSFLGSISNSQDLGISKVVYATSEIKKTEQNIDNA